MIRARLAQQIHAALVAGQQAGDLPEFAIPAPAAIAVERPRQPEHGDFATPLALHLARAAHRAPREIAEALLRHLPTGEHELIAGAEIAGPGFVNLRIAPSWLQRQVDEILTRGAGYADLDSGAGQAAQVEFISANPTGPLTVGHARNAVLGDTMARLLEAAGYQVTREYYFNDGGLQMRNLAESVRLRALQELGSAIDYPDSYYAGEYIQEIASALLAAHGPTVVDQDWQFLRDQAVAAIFADIRHTQERLGISFEVYTNEMSFFAAEQPDNVWRIAERLQQAGIAYEAHGATWFRATAFGADKDRVLLRSPEASIFARIRAAQSRLGVPFEPYPNEQKGAFYDPQSTPNVWSAIDDLRRQNLLVERGDTTWFRASSYGAQEDVVVWQAGEPRQPTYRLPDIAYHLNKLERGFKLVVDILGADHIAQFPDIRAALAALGHDPSRIQVLSYQFVTLVRNGELVKMSTRRANYVTLDQLIDEVGPDAVRYFMISRTPQTPFEFDLALATKQSDENPVYYIQYAHTRAVSILERSAPERGISFDALADVGLLRHPVEMDLIRLILRLPEEIEAALTRLEPHHLAYYARDLAAGFTAFYHECRVVDPEQPALSQARLKLTRAAQIALARSLELMGMQAPSEM